MKNLTSLLSCYIVYIQYTQYNNGGINESYRSKGTLQEL